MALEKLECKKADHVHFKEKEIKMKIQFALSRPFAEASSPNNRASVIAGIVICEREFSDYDVMPIEFPKPGAPGVRCDAADFILSDKHLDNLANRHDDPKQIQGKSFISALQGNLWRSSDASHPSGEVALVKTRMPDIPEGQHAYALFGIIRGEPADLRSLCERVYETTAALAQGVMTSTGSATYTGREVANIMQENLLISLHSKHVWGFSEEKLAVMATTTISNYDQYNADLQHLATHGVHLSKESNQQPPCPEHLNYAREMSARGMLPLPMCETREQGEKMEKIMDELHEADLNRMITQYDPNIEDVLSADHCEPEPR
ncbi:hypothetical protein ALP54_03503 [Pseudomonas amygdali pv. lachrymans]|nr:hypothetical protein ALP54_03503 [Pseudomonas amygdali pv. lachrymans]